ncbi:MAG TPA: biopolymer transporter ExbD [Kofleriaceae bacterium]|jgi:biopolymer transport protein TolR|nr:biopolymer transporter ExbD [Kofleriaceae bacterium]
MGMKAGGSQDELNSEINVTPMVDVMLVLLVIFMITAPLLNAGVDVQLPEVRSPAVDDPNEPLVLTIDAQRHLTLGTTPVKWANLEKLLESNEKVKQQGMLFVQADKTLTYDVVVTAMAIAKEAHVAKVMALTAPSDTIKVEDLDR